jgi:site-specific DNA recombinase
MKQCFGYVRVSTQKQGEGVSLEAQRAAIEQFADRNDIIISRWFEEKQTAAKRGRRCLVQCSKP